MKLTIFRKLHTIPARAGAITGVILSIYSCIPAAFAQGNFQPLSPVPIQQVTIQDDFWTPKRQLWQQTTIPDCLAKFEANGGLANFDRIRDGLTGGHIGQPFLDGLVYETIRGSADFLLANPDPALETRLDGYITRIAAAAAKDTNGFINTYTQLQEPTHRWGLNGGNDVFSHDVYNASALVEAGVHYYRATGKIQLLQVATKLANYMADVMGPAPKANVVPGHALGEEALVRLYQLFKEQPQLKAQMLVPVDEQRYLALAQFWIDNRGDHTGRADFGAYDQDAVPLQQQETLEGHAVRATLFCAGVIAAGLEAGRQDYLDNGQRLWNSLVLHRMYITGGLGSQAADEKIGEDYELPNLSGYLETCAAVGNSFFHRNMNLALGDAGYVDELERSLYNGALVCVSQAGNSYFYENPLESYNGRARWDWNYTPCCPPMFLKLMGAMPGYIYAQDTNGIYVNLFVGSHANVTLNNHDIIIAQETQYPWKGDIKVTVQPDQATSFAVNLRLPAWCAQPTLKLNGQTIVNYQKVRGYAHILRTWNPGDVLELSLPMEVRRVKAHPQVKFDSGCVALQRGPLIYCLESVDNNGHVANLAIPSGAALQTEEHPELLGGVVLIKGTASASGTYGMTNTAFTAIPYYAQANRQTGELMVWIPESDSSLPGASQGPLMIKNGNFEAPAVGSNSVATILLSQWYSSVNNNPWPLGWWRTVSRSQAVEFPPNTWIYQCLGVYNKSFGTNLGWSFVQGIPTDANGSGAFQITFYAQTGSFLPSHGVDIAASSGCQTIGSFSFNSMNKDGLQSRLNSGTVGLGGLADGTLVWAKIANTGADSGNGWAPIDDVFVCQNFGSPAFVSNPKDQNAYASFPLSLSALAVNGTSISYQWYHIASNGSSTNAVPGGASSNLIINSPGIGDAGGYYAVASNPYGSSTSRIAQVQILARQSSLTVINGDFEDPAMGTNSTEDLLVPGWYSSSGNNPWPLGSGRLQAVQSQAAEFPPNSWLYQCLGTYNRAQGTNLNWLFTQPIPTDNNGSGAFVLEFYAQTGAFTPNIGTDISANPAFTKFGSFSFDSLNHAGLKRRLNSGTVGLGSLADGTVVWIRIANAGSDGAGNGWAPLDDVVSNQNTGKPYFITSPTNQTVYTLTPATLASLAVNGSKMSYNWHHLTTNGTLNVVPGATNSSLTLSWPTPGDSGGYFVIASNSLGTATSSVAQITVLSHSASLGVINGDFENPPTGSTQNPLQLANWFTVASYTPNTWNKWPWPNSSAFMLSGSQAAEFPPGSWIYQNLGVYNHSLGTNLSWSFVQVTPTDNNASGAFRIDFYAQTGAFLPSHGVDISGNGAFTSLANYSFNSLNKAGLVIRTNSGALNLSGLTDGAAVWIRIANTGADTGNGWAPIDNVDVTQNCSSPIIISNPASQTNYANCPVGLTVAVQSSSPVSYQWYRVNSGSIDLATNSTLAFNRPTSADSGDYFVVASNSFGSSTSTVAHLTILPRAAGLSTINGDFEQDPLLNPNQENLGFGIKWWFSSTGSQVWQYGAAKIQSDPPHYYQSQAVCFEPGGWIYQCLGQYDSTRGTNLLWSLTQCSLTNGNASSGFDLRFYAQTGSFIPKDGVDIDDSSGLTPLTVNPVKSFNSLNRSSLVSGINKGSINLGGLAPGTLVWIRVAAIGFDPFAGGPYSLYSDTASWNDVNISSSGANAALDDISVSQVVQIPSNLNCGIHANGEIHVEWTYGTLMQATNLAGPWIEMPFIESPAVVQPTYATQVFYRIKLQ